MEALFYAVPFIMSLFAIGIGVGLQWLALQRAVECSTSG